MCGQGARCPWLPSPSLPRRVTSPGPDTSRPPGHLHFWAGRTPLSWHTASPPAQHPSPRLRLEKLPVGAHFEGSFLDLGDRRAPAAWSSELPLPPARQREQPRAVAILTPRQSEPFPAAVSEGWHSAAHKKTSEKRGEARASLRSRQSIIVVSVTACEVPASHLHLEGGAREGKGRGYGGGGSAPAPTQPPRAGEQLQGARAWPRAARGNLPLHYSPLDVA